MKASIAPHGFNIIMYEGGKLAMVKVLDRKLILNDGPEMCAGFNQYTVANIIMVSRPQRREPAM